MSAHEAHRPPLHPGWGRLVESLLIIALGATAIGIVWSGHYLRYVRPEMAIPLVLTGVLLIALGGWTMIVTCRRPRTAEYADDHHGHGGVWSVWLIIVPVVIAAVISPPALGAQLAQRRSAPPPPPSSGSTFRPLPASDPLGMPLGEYAQRAVGGGEAELAGRRFSISGFVINQHGERDWYLARIWIRCCAADAVPVMVRIVGAEPQSDDGWLEVTGTYLPTEQTPDGSVAQLQAESVRPVDPPENPYIFG